MQSRAFLTLLLVVLFKPDNLCGTVSNFINSNLSCGKDFVVKKQRNLYRL